MSTLSNSKINQILQNEFGEDILFEARSEWASTYKDYRSLIRSFIGSLDSFQSIDKSSIINLDTPPPILNLSISHCPELGAVFFNPNAAHAGVDVEREDRVKDSIIKRVCTEKEIKAAPKPVALWCAKEASFKAINRFDINIKVLSQVFIQDWQYIDEGVYSFAASINSKDSSSPEIQVTQGSKKSDHLQQGDQKLNGKGLMIQQNVHFFTFYSQ